MPDPHADSDGDGLLEALRARIRREGPLPVDAYMRACLADPQHGYWHKSLAIGAEGDFVTAPEISQVFGELLGVWSAVVWQAMGRPSPVRLVELGPGRGTLMRDALRAALAAPAFLAAASLHLVEVSPRLRALQRRSLASSPHQPAGGAAWHESLAQVPDGPAVVIANEFLDALPIRQLVYGERGWHERVVELAPGGALQFAVGPRVNIPWAEPAPEPGTVLELRQGEDELIADLVRRRGMQACLIIDYGPAAPALGDTLQAVRRHAWVDPLTRPGEADLTAHVQFARLAARARGAGLAVDGPLSQAELLGRLGSAERASRLMAANPARAPEIEAGVQRLVSPTGMGGQFKAMALRTPALPTLVPFD